MAVWGMPYQGGKTRLAKKIISTICDFVPAHASMHLYDLCAGGCAVTHCAMSQQLFKGYHASDIGKTPKAFTSRTTKPRCF